MADAKAEDPEKQRRSCFQRFKAAVSLVPQDATPPNWGILWLIFISLFSSSFTLTFLFPFLPEMIQTFGYSEEEKGTYVGLVASSVFAGRAVGSFFWGWLSDIKGRRLVLLVTIFFNGLFSFLFGFIGSLGPAMALRFLAGLANGTVGVAKTVLYDISDNTNQAFSMSIISLAWGSGLILGPMTGGYLALPAAKYPGVFSGQGFFADFPFILPSVCCLVVCGIVFVVVFFKFQEPKVVLNKEYETEVVLSSDSLGDVATESLQTDHKDQVTVLSLPLLDKLRAESVSSIPNKANMSMETLHCETELSYFYAQQLCSQSSQQSLSTSAGNAVSKSMCNLSPRTMPVWEEENALLPESRLRSNSLGNHAPRASTVNGIVDPKENQVFPKSSNPKTVAEVILGEPNQNIAMLDEHHANGNLKHETSASTADKNYAVVNLKEENAETEGGSEKKRSVMSSCWHSINHSALVQLLRLSDVRHSVTLYTVMSFAVIGYEDVFTIFASTSVDYNGLGFSTDEIGLALGVVSLPLIFIQIKLYPILVAKFGIKRAYLINIFFIFIPIQLVPMVHMLTNNKVWLWTCLMVLTLSMRIAMNSCFTGSSLLINNSVTSKHAGKANGLGMTCTAIARTLAPTIGGALFSWSLKMNRAVGPPLDVNLTFAVFGLVLFFTAVHAVFLPEHLDHQKK